MKKTTALYVGMGVFGALLAHFGYTYMHWQTWVILIIVALVGHVLIDRIQTH